MKVRKILDTVEKKVYVVNFKKDSYELTTHLEKKDADECVNGIKCVYLGIQIGEFLKNFDKIEKEKNICL